MLGSDLMSRLGGDHEVVGKDIEDFDLTSFASVRDVVEEARPEVLINAAAYTDVDGAERDEARCFAVNALGVENVVRACGPLAVCVVHISTDYVFDGTKGSPYTEEDSPSPLGVYARSKAEGERILISGGGDYLLIRTAWLYGRHGRNFVRTILDKARAEGRLAVVSDQFGSPTWSWDLAGAIKHLLENNHRGIFHVTNRGSCSWYDFACKILSYAGLEGVKVEAIPSSRLDRPAPRPPYAVLSGRKFNTVTGRTMRPWQLALREFVAKMARNGVMNDLT